MTLETIEIETAPDPQAAVIWLHGLGADGNDFVPIMRELDLDGLVPIRFIFPHAPKIPVSINNGYVMRAWYDIIVSGTMRQEDEAGLRRSQAAVEALIAHEVARGIPPHRIVLAGFSQGCAMTLLTGLRHTQRLAGLIALSGYLPLAERTLQERADSNRDIPIFMAHGRHDPMIALDRAEASRHLLRSLGYSVAWHTYPMPHSVCADEVIDLSRWLQGVLPHRTAR